MLLVSYKCHYDIPKPAGGQDVFHAGPCQSGWPGKK